MLPVHAISARSSTWRGGALSSFSLAGSISLSLKDSEERRRSSCVRVGFILLQFWYVHCWLKIVTKIRMIMIKETLIKFNREHLYPR